MTSDRTCATQLADRSLSRRALLTAAAHLAGVMPLVGLTACVPPGGPVPGGPFGPQPGFGPGFAGGPYGGPGFTLGPENAGAVIAIAMTNDLQFVPQVATIRAGQSIAWRNVSRFVHTVTFDPTLARRPGDVLLPPGVPPFTTGDVMPGQTVSYRFMVPGQYRYFCIPHELQNMVGGVNVAA